MKSQRVLLAALLLLSAPLSSAQEDQGEALRAAAREGDAGRIEELLAAGVPVDAPNRYGATALFFAADRGHLEVVRRLADAGAALDIEDRFYQMTALSRAAGSGHREVVFFLLGRGTPGVGGLLARAARQGDEELLRAVLDNGNFDEDALAAAREAADSESVAALLRERTARAVAAPELTEEARQALAGSYWNETTERGVRVVSEDGMLRARSFERDAASGEERFTGPGVALMPRGGPRSFVTESGARYRFPGRGGMVERLVVEPGGEWELYQPVGESESRAAAPEVAEAPRLADSAPDVLVPLQPRPWPQFRGPRGAGVADEQGVPLHWNAADAEGIAWEAALPGLGVSSPIVWEDEVYVVIAASVTGDTEFRIGLYGDVAPVENESEHRFELRALDLRTGEPRWTTEIARGVPMTRRHTKSSQANATPVTDGERIVTLLGSMGVLLAHDLDGNLLWEREVGVLNSGWFYDPDYQWGHASSPVIHGGAVIVLADVHGDAFLGAFDLEDGEPLWRTARDEVSTFSTPFVHDVGGQAEVVVNGTVIRGYDAATGAERWRLGPNSEIPISVPLLGDGLLFVQAGYPPIRPIYAIRPGMEGDLSLAPGEESSEAIAWSKDRGGVYIPSPIFYRGVLYLNANNGRLSAYDGETGERLYRARIGGIGGSYAASPFAADGRLYFTTEEGDTFVVRAGREYELLAKNTVDRIVMASPAASGGVLVIRAIDRLFGITR
ncbi:MAG: PQQ-binding-like beta-propeller repeat protein [Acidobacteriota bacterium]|nr:PQQ-binding-like beta-propeller repeat protein [Acidobacteriota bacterium]